MTCRPLPPLVSESKRISDFSPETPIRETFTAQTTTSEKICRIANNILLVASLYEGYCWFYGLVGFFPLLTGILAARKIITVIIGLVAYPVTSTSIPGVSGNIQKKGDVDLNTLREQGFIVSKKFFYKSGTRYEAVLIGHKDTIENGKWTISALGNCMIIQDFFIEHANKSKALNSNLLLINGPAVVGSGGWPTGYQMGAGYEAGLQFLEKKIPNLTHVQMTGYSLGGGMIAEAILNHDFSSVKERGIKYMLVSDRTFGKLSSIAEYCFSFLVRPLFFFTGLELDSVKAAEKMTRLNFRHVIVQHTSEDSQGHDGAIPDSVSLAHELGEATNRQFIGSDRIFHFGPGSLPLDLQRNLHTEMDQFFKSS